MAGFACLLSRDPDLRVNPYWCFTDPCIEDFMSIAVGRTWDTYTVGTRIEAFLLAGGSMKGENLSAKKRVLFLKATIRNSFNKKLSKSLVLSLKVLF